MKRLTNPLTLMMMTHLPKYHDELDAVRRSRGSDTPCHPRTVGNDASGLDVRVGGGIRTARNFLRAELVASCTSWSPPIILGRGSRLWDDLPGLDLTHKVTTEVAESV